MTEKQWERLIESGGVLDPQGEVWWPSREAMEGEDFCRKLWDKGETSMEAYLPARTYLRPTLLSLRNCRMGAAGRADLPEFTCLVSSSHWLRTDYRTKCSGT